MNGDFSRILALLRKEKGISQKQAAADLGISQALLSHYEKGIRECGLNFLVRCADYYGVPCDYLLGRTADPSGVTLSVDDIPDPESGKENVWKGSVLPTLNKKIIFNSLNILFDQLSKSKNKALTNEVSAFLMLATYRMFRVVYSADPKNQQGIFALPQQLSSGYAAGEMQMCEANASAIAEGKGAVIPGADDPGKPVRLPLSSQALTDSYPLCATSLFSLIRSVETRILGKGKDSLS